MNRSQFTQAAEAAARYVFGNGHNPIGQFLKKLNENLDKIENETKEVNEPEPSTEADQTAEYRSPLPIEEDSVPYKDWHEITGVPPKQASFNPNEQTDYKSKDKNFRKKN